MPAVPSIVYQAIGIGGLLVTIGSVIWLAITLRRPRPLKLLSPLISLSMVPLSLIVYVFFLKVRMVPWVAVPLIILGLLLGIRWGQAMRLSVANGRIIGQCTIAYLILWGLSFAVTQALATLTSSRIAALGVTTMFFAAGSAIGTNGDLIIRLLATKWRLWRGKTSKNEQFVCPACRRANPPGTKFCLACGAPLPLATGAKGDAR